MESLQQVVFDAIERVCKTEENPTHLPLHIKSYMASEVSDSVKGWAGTLDSDTKTIDVFYHGQKVNGPIELQIRSIISDTLEVSGESLDQQTVDSLVFKIKSFIEGH